MREGEDPERKSGSEMMTFGLAIRAIGCLRYAGWNESIVAIQAENRRANELLAGVVILCLAGSALLWVLISGGIVTPIRRTADMLKDISEGEGDLPPSWLPSPPPPKR